MRSDLGGTEWPHYSPLVASTPLGVTKSRERLSQRLIADKQNAAANRHRHGVLLVLSEVTNRLKVVNEQVRWFRYELGDRSVVLRTCDLAEYVALGPSPARESVLWIELYTKVLPVIRQRSVRRELGFPNQIQCSFSDAPRPDYGVGGIWLQVTDGAFDVPDQLRIHITELKKTKLEEASNVALEAFRIAE